MMAPMFKYALTGWPSSPIWYASSALTLWSELRSSAVWIATVEMPSSYAALNALSRLLLRHWHDSALEPE